MSRERTAILQHAGTVMVGQLAVMAFGVTDTLVASHHADTALAALAVASAAYITVHISLMGALQALLPIWAELHGAQNHSLLGQSVRQALYLWGLLSVMGMVALFNPGPLLSWTQVPLHLQGEVREYLSVVAWGIPASLLFRLYSTLNQSLGRPQSVTWIQLCALLVKIPLSIIWVLGIPDWLPAHGLVGCAWATLLVTTLMAATSIAFLYLDPFYKTYRLFLPLEKPLFSTQMQFLRLGLPSGLTVGVEVTSFTLMALFIARLGIAATASHQIVSNLAAVLYMIPLSLSIATSARISYWRGAARHECADLALRCGLELVTAISLGLGVVLAWNAHGVAALYSHSAEVVALTANLMFWLALYHVADAIQVLCVFVLRCYGVTVVPLLIYTVMLWGLGLAGGYAVTYGDIPALIDLEELGRQSPTGFWQSACLALYVTAFLLLLMLWRIRHRHADRND